MMPDIFITGIVVALFGSMYLIYNVWIAAPGTTSRRRTTLQGMTGASVDLVLLEREELSHDTRRFRLALPSPDHVLGLPVGQHLSLRYVEPDSGKVIARSYTPVTSDDARGYVDLVIKVYFKNVHPKFPLGGKMSQHLNDLQIGQTITVCGPKGKLTYVGKGQIQIKHRVKDKAVEKRMAKKIGMIAGGTGITPLLQIIRQALKDPRDATEFYLLFANQTERDILLRDELDVMTQEHTNVHVWYTIDRQLDTKVEWNYSLGFVTSEMIKAHLPAPASTTQILMCGPPPMIKFAILPALEKLQYTADMYFGF